MSPINKIQSNRLRYNKNMALLLVKHKMKEKKKRIVNYSHHLSQRYTNNHCIESVKKERREQERRYHFICGTLFVSHVYSNTNKC